MDDVPGLRSELIDVSDLDLDVLAALPESVLTAALRRIVAEKTQAPDHYAAFQNFI